jgi:regulator of sirC expression with transglutaminase-like and TPR domain
VRSRPPASTTRRVAERVVDPDLHSFRDLFRGPDAQIDLGLAALAIARVEHPDLAADKDLVRLDDLADRSGAAAARGCQAALDRLVGFLFGEEGFRGNADEYYDPRNSCLNDVLDRKLGIPITLSVLMIEVGRRVGLTIAGVGLPGHFIVSAEVGERRVLIDPFNGGVVLTPARAADVAAKAVGRPVKLEDAHWAPCSKRQIVVRMLRNLKTIYAKQTSWSRALAVVDRLLVVDANSPTHLRDRGTVLVKLGKLYEGVAEWERYLKRYPDAQDADTFRQELRRIRQELGSLN